MTISQQELGRRLRLARERAPDRCARRILPRFAHRL